MQYHGELAALATAFLWSFTSLFFTSAGRRIGSYWVNKFRIPVAIILLGTTLLITTGRLIPLGVTSSAYYYLIISGIIGLTIGDTFLFRAFVILGPRLTLLIFTTSPIITAISAWFLIDETLGILAVTGIAITLSGIAWVTAERRFNTDTTPNNYADKGSKTSGVMLALGGSACQSVGLVLAKAGMQDGLDPLPATFIRMLAAGISIWLYSFVIGDYKQALKRYKDGKALLLATGGAVCGPFLGVWMSLVAVHYTEAGIAAAIMATVPVMVIPLVIFFYKEKVSYRAIIGAAIAAAGVAILFLE